MAERYYTATDRGHRTPGRNERRRSTMSDFKVMNVLGRGNFGTVSKIIRLRDNETLVWKEVRYQGMSDRDRKQLVAEVNVLKLLKHPHIIEYVDRIVDKQNSRLLIVMTYCSNGDLAQMLKKHATKREYLSNNTALCMFSQLVDAVACCHAQRIVHRDIKPSNVFLDQNGSVKLGDFGLARILPMGDLATTNVGTPYYQSPEILHGQSYDDKCDVWALGCILYELAMLKIPFEAKNYKQLATMVVKSTYEPVSSVYSPELRQIVQSTLRKRGVERPSARELSRLPAIESRIQQDRAPLRKFEQLAQKFAPADRHAKVRAGRADHDDGRHYSTDDGRTDRQDTTSHIDPEKRCRSVASLTIARAARNAGTRPTVCREERETRPVSQERSEYTDPKKYLRLLRAHENEPSASSRAEERGGYADPKNLRLLRAHENEPSVSSRPEETISPIVDSEPDVPHKFIRRLGAIPTPMGRRRSEESIPHRVEAIPTPMSHRYRRRSEGSTEDENDRYLRGRTYLQQKESRSSSSSRSDAVKSYARRIKRRSASTASASTLASKEYDACRDDSTEIDLYTREQNLMKREELLRQKEEAYERKIALQNEKMESREDWLGRHYDAKYREKTTYKQVATHRDERMRYRKRD